MSNYIAPSQSSSSQVTRMGRLHIVNRTTGKVGQDATYSFGKTVTLENGNKSLKVDPNDLLYFCELNFPLENNKRIRVDLPSSLFDQARRGNKIFFTQQGINYELELKPTQMYQDIPFDDFAGAIKEDFKTSRRDFKYEADIPDDYLAFAKENDLYYLLSPNAKQITLEKKGTSPVNFEDMSLFVVNAESQGREERHKNNLGEIDALIFKVCVIGRPQVDIFLDGNNLYVLLDTSAPLEGWKSGGTYGDTVTEKSHFFRHDLIDTHGKNIDENNIAASLNGGVLKILVPLSDISTKTKILARCDVGLGNKLFVRGEGASSLNWDKGLEMTCVQSPDLWAAEVEQSANLQYKFLLNDLNWEKGDNHQVEAGKTQEIVPQFQ